MSTFYIIEGATCSGKTTLTRSIQVNYSGHVILEHPPLSKGQAPDLASYYEHQLNVFESFMAYFDGAPFGLWYVDYSPFGCIPFTRALVRTGIDACAPLIPYFIRQCNELCKRHELYLYQYMSVEYHIMRQRLIHRKRKGDDTWSEELLRALCEEYDEFFQNGGLILGAGNRITGVHDPYAVTTKRTDLIPKQPHLWAVYPPPPPPPPEPEDDYKPLPIEDEMYTLKQNGTKIELLDDDTVVSSIDIADIVASMASAIGLDSHELIRVGNTVSLAKDGVPYSSVNLDSYALSRVGGSVHLSKNGVMDSFADLDTYALSRVDNTVILEKNGAVNSLVGLDRYALSRVGYTVSLEKNDVTDSSFDLDRYLLSREGRDIQLEKNGSVYSKVGLDRYALSRVEDQLRLSVNDEVQNTVGLDSYTLSRVDDLVALEKNTIVDSAIELDSYALSQVDDTVTLEKNGVYDSSVDVARYELSRVGDYIRLIKNGSINSSALIDHYTLNRVDDTVTLEKNGVEDSSVELDSYSLARNNSSIRLMKDDVEDSSVDVAYIIADALADSITTNRVDLTYDPVSVDQTINTAGVHGEPRILDRGENRAPIIVLDAGDVVLVRGSRTLEELMGTPIIHVGDKFTITDPAPSTGIYLAASKDGGFVEPTNVDSRSKVFLGAGTYMALSSSDITNRDTVVLVKKLG